MTSSWVPGDTATRLLLVRHGATTRSHERRFSGRDDLPLDDAGESQAAALAAAFGQGRFGPVDAVVSSPLRRARRTAEVVAARFGLDVAVDEDLVETDFGAWEGLTFAEAAERDPQLLPAWRGSPDAAPPAGESFADVGRRVLAARDRLLASHAGRHVVVVSHVTPIKQLLRAALDAPPSLLFRLFLDTASVSRVDYAADASPSVRLVNDTAHLFVATDASPTDEAARQP